MTEMNSSAHSDTKYNIPDRLMQSIRMLDSSISGTRLLPTSSRISATSYTPRCVQQDAVDVSSHLSSSYFFGSFSDLNKSSAVLISGEKQTHKTSKNVAVADGNLLEKPNPGETAIKSLFNDYLNAYQNNHGENLVFDLIGDYIELCHEKLNTLNSLMVKLPSNQSKCRQIVVIKNVLQNEMNTWELVRLLYEDRLLVENTNDVVLALMETSNKYVSEKQFVDLLYERDALLRQSQLVVNWLEAMTSKEIEENNYDRLEFFSDKGFCWKHTLNILEQKTMGNSLNVDERSIVTELDPDAPHRQNKPLADLDKENELHFLKCLFLHVRSGQFDEAERLCAHHGQMWRAATLQGWKLFHDPNYENLGPDGKPQELEGNYFRDVWKLACWNLSEEECCQPHERAIYGSFCGNLKAILPVCTTWEEYLWAYYRVMIDTKVETELRSNFVTSRDLEDLPLSYWNRPNYSPEIIFQELKASSSESVQHASIHPFHIIQKYIILDDMEGLIEEMYDQIKNKQNHDYHFVRFIAHFILFLRTIGRTTREELCVALLEEYVKLLISDRQINLVAAYTSTLPKLKQNSWYAHFLEDITDREQRQLCLQLAEEAGLDVPLITKTVVENICLPSQVASVGENDNFQSVITEEDRQKVDAIDWLVFDSSQRAEAMRQANALMRQFIASQKLDAARAVFTKVPPDSIDLIMKRRKVSSTTTDENITREYLCLQAYLQAHDAFSDWFELFHHSKPECPVLPAGASFTERVSHEHKETQYLADMDRWKHTLDLQTNVTVGKMYNVLLFVDGGWMVDQITEENVDENRALQMKRLRELCLPQITLLLHSVLHATGRYKDALQIADVIASENYQLYKEFPKQELQRLLLKLRESSLHLLDQSLDSFGYAIK